VRLAIQICAYVVGLPLEILVINAMRSGAWRRYPFLFFYVIADFITTVVEIEPSLQFANPTPATKARWRTVYWVDEQVIQALLFLLVLSLLYRASAQLRSRRPLLMGIAAATVVYAAVTFLIYFSPTAKTGEWMTPWTASLNFCAAILNLILWALLLSSRERDRRLLMISGALGIQSAGGAMGQALRNISTQLAAKDTLELLTALLIIIFNVTCTYIWWQAFRNPSLDAKNEKGESRPPADPPYRHGRNDR